MKQYICLACIACLSTFLTSCGQPGGNGDEQAETEKFTVYTVNYPLQYFSERIAGDTVKVVFPVPEGVDPIFWRPDVETIAAYQQADLVVLNGAGYAQWVTQATLPRSRTIDTSAKLKEQYIRMDDVVTHTHGPDGEHAHEGIAFTTWLDMSFAAEQAKAIADALIDKLPEHRTQFMKNYAALRSDLLKLDEEIRMIVTPAQDLPLVASHPVYQYFARRYGLNIVSVHWESDEIPTAEQQAELTAILKDHPVEWMLWEGYPRKETVDLLEKHGIGRLIFQPCGNKVSDGDFLQVMRQNADNLKEAYR
jgi:zinc transport system substrate-binding protein